MPTKTPRRGGVKLAEPAVRISHAARSRRSLPSRCEDVIDTTAAGDSFAAAYLAARLGGAEPAAAAMSGHRLAGAVVRHRGAIVPRSAMPRCGESDFRGEASMTSAKPRSRMPDAKLEEILRVAPIIPVITIERAADAVPLARALVAGGLKALEITLRTPRRRLRPKPSPGRCPTPSSASARC